MPTYVPLPDCLTLKQSKVHGLGLFATKNIPDNTELGLSHLIIKGSLFRTPLGGFYNHSVRPNCIKYEKNNLDQKITYYYLRTIRNISAGEEVTVTYTFYDIE
tara:strand:+ start:168 stop:476 length:309 start_codon:yes stop_codon:yes gene_type:complete